MRIGSRVVTAFFMVVAATATATSADRPSSNAVGDASSAVDAPAGVQPNPTELVLVPILPCRLFDTSAGGAGGAIGAKKTRDFTITGSSGFTTQGGAASGCGVPASATAIALTLTAVDAKGAGNLSVFPSGAAKPKAASLFYPKEAAASSSPVIGINNGRLSVYSSKATNVIGDVTGYFAPQITGQVGLTGTLQSSTTRVLSSVRIGLGVYSVTLDRDITSCTVASHPFGSGGFIVNAFPSGSKITANAYRLNGTPVDINWQFQVSC